MISLSNSKKLAEKVRGEEMPRVYSELTLRDWSHKGVISHMKTENGNALYPDIVTTEILTALRLKKKYSLDKIAEARQCLELEGGHLNQITEEEIIRFMNCSKLFKDKKLVAKLTMDHIDSLAQIKELIDDLVKEKDHLEVVEDYLIEFLEAEKELKSFKESQKTEYVS